MIKKNLVRGTLIKKTPSLIFKKLIKKNSMENYEEGINGFKFDKFFGVFFRQRETSHL